MPTLSVLVKPRSHASSLEQRPDGTWLARLRSPPVDGKANAELIELFAAHFGCAKSAVTIRSGAASRMKLVTVPGAPDERPAGGGARSGPRA